MGLGIARQPHNMRRLKDSISEVASRGGKVIDQRTAIGKSLMRWRSALVQHLGGEESLSTQQLAIIDVAMRTRLLLDSTDAWLIRQPGLIDKRRKQLYPIVQQRTALADSLVRQLTTLGLGRQAKKAPNLSDYLAAHDEPEKPPLAAAASGEKATSD
jgi:hypothetical protein